MTDALFFKLIDMSVVAGFVIIWVFILRLVLRRAPKIFSYLLWTAVLFRLLCPVSFESAVSLVPQNTYEAAQFAIHEPYTQMGSGAENMNSNSDVFFEGMAAEKDTAYHKLMYMDILKIVWIAGLAGMLIYSLLKLIILRRQLVGAVLLRGNIYLADHISSPFVMGIFMPKIYLPSTLSENEQEYIILHEETHIKRFDHIVKVIAFLALCIHWFNPLVWAAFIFFSRDMEMSCDERVMKTMGDSIRSEYCKSLLSLATGRKAISGVTLAFGEGDTKERIKNVLNYKKPAFWVVIVSAIFVLAACFSLSANLSDGETKSSDTFMEDIYSYRTQYVGNAPNVGNILSRLEFPYELNRDGMALHTSGEPYGLDMRFTSDYPFEPVSDMNRVMFLKNSSIMFSLVENLDEINLVINGEVKLSCTRNMCESYVGANLWKESRTFSDFTVLCERIDEHLRSSFAKAVPDGLFVAAGGISVPVAVYPNPLDVPLSEIKDTLNTVEVKKYTGGDVPFRVYCAEYEQFGTYRIYDAETYEELRFDTENNMAPQTYILENTNIGNLYIVSLEYGTWDEEMSKIAGDTLLFMVKVV